MSNDCTVLSAPFCRVPSPALHLTKIKYSFSNCPYLALATPHPSPYLTLNRVNNLKPAMIEIQLKVFILLKSIPYKIHE